MIVVSDAGPIIALARIDELVARNIAESLGLKVSGTVGILLKAKELKLIGKLKPYLNDLRNKNVWISDEVYKMSEIFH